MSPCLGSLVQSVFPLAASTQKKIPLFRLENPKMRLPFLHRRAEPHGELGNLPGFFRNPGIVALAYLKENQVPVLIQPVLRPRGVREDQAQEGHR